MEELYCKIKSDSAFLPKSILQQAEHVKVEQEVDAAWEARIKLPLLVDKMGYWKDLSTSELTSLPRIRIEVKIGESGLVPLIDGSLISVESPRNTSPGQSYMTLVVQDDTYYMDRDQVAEVTDWESPDRIATTIFSTFDFIEEVKADTPNSAPESTPSRESTRRDTAIKFLRKLARPYGYKAFVLPGKTFSKSIGCFRKVPVEDNKHKPAPLFLVGPKQNINSFNIQDHTPNAANYFASAISSLRREIESTQSNPGDEDRQASQPGVADNRRSTRYNHPDDNTADTQQAQVQSSAERSSYIYEGSGQTNINCYKSVLIPYIKVDVGGVGEKMSGSWVITKVTHEFGKASYSQSFVLGRNSINDSSTSATQETPSEIP